MDQSTTVSFRKKLLAMRAELESVVDIAQESSGTVELDQARVGRLSRMDAMQAQAMSQESDRRRELTLTRIAAALERIDEGEYGDCLSCDEPIAEPRLEFDPAATLCIECASRAEE